MGSRKVFLDTILGVVIGAARRAQHRAGGPLLVLVALALGLGCSQSDSTAPSQARARGLPPLSAFSIRPQLNANLQPGNGSGKAAAPPRIYTACTPLGPQSEKEKIGSEGGTLEIGPHALVVPAGALTQRVEIMAWIVSDSVNSIKFEPSGLQFLKPVYLFLSYANCAKSPIDPVQVLYTSDDLTVVQEQLPSFDDLPGRTVVGLITHFSRYAVAY